MDERLLQNRINMKTIIIIPAFNEQAAIGEVVEKSLQYADDVLVVDDGSADDTSEIARNAGASLLKHPTNFGKGISLRDAFKQVEGYDVVAGSIISVNDDEESFDITVEEIEED